MYIFIYLDLLYPLPLPSSSPPSLLLSSLPPLLPHPSLLPLPPSPLPSLIPHPSLLSSLLVSPVKETELLVQALRLNTLSKLTFADSKRFDALIRDVFPGAEFKKVEQETLVEALRQATQEMNLEVVETQVRVTACSTDFICSTCTCSCKVNETLQVTVIGFECIEIM